MANLKHKTRGNSSPQGKPRVYFCCHPDDFGAYFESISDDILAKQNCTIWYTDEAITRGEDFFADLKQMQLFVMPVTTNLLCTENEALGKEFNFAIENHIPILPLIQEKGLEELFNKKCGDLQFLDKNNTDITAISYDEKLKKYLESVLIGDELAEKIRAAFDAYVFLSYRKKDRKYAQELMRLIHKNDFYRDIAIWYDEFLTPGENFNDLIKEALQKSSLFVLAVTPNLVNEPNYIMTTEYPMARQEGKPILPAELVPTDKDELSEKYEGIPNPADVHNEDEFSEALFESIKKMAIKENDASPEHNFFIGLAYLGGVDVEVDYERALSLITSAAKNNLPEACKKLVSIYIKGEGVKSNLVTGIEWQKRYLDLVKSKYCSKNCEDACILYLEAELELARLEIKAEMVKDARNTCWRVIKLCRSNGGYGEFISEYRIPCYFEAYLLLGNVFSKRNDIGQARECYEKACNTFEKSLCNTEEDIQIQKKAGILYYKLSKVFSEEPFYDPQITKKYLDKSVEILKRLLQRENDMEFCRHLGLCYYLLAKNYTHSLSNISEAVEASNRAYEIFKELLEKSQNTENYINICMSHLQLGKLYLDIDQKVALEHYSNAIDICMEFTDINSLVAMQTLCTCYLSILNSHKKLGGRLWYKKICTEVLNLAKYLFCQYPSPISKELLAETYFQLCLYHKQYKEYAVMALQFYHELSSINPEKYANKFWECRQTLWNRKVIGVRNFPTVELIAKKSKNGKYACYIDLETGAQYELDFVFVDDAPLSAIVKIEIAKFLLERMKPIHASKYEVEPAIKVLQLSKKSIIGTRKNPMPDEFVYITLDDEEKRKEKYQLCYG